MPTRSPELSVMEQAVLAGHVDELLHGLTDREAEELLYRWDLWGRPAQYAPPDMGLRYRIWLLRAGRGFGKTRTGAEQCRIMSERVERMALVSMTRADVRDVMIEGESGIISCFPRRSRPVYEASRRRVVFPSGSMAYIYSGEQPERLRGPQHGWAWVDEPASLRGGEDLISNLLLGLRLGIKRDQWLMMTGTPKMLPWLKKLADRRTTIETRGSTFDNLSNLTDSFIDDVVDRFDGTRLGRQELYAEWLEDVEGALWNALLIDEFRIAADDEFMDDPWGKLRAWQSERELTVVPAQESRSRAWRPVVGVDPPAESAECGIVVAAAPVRGRAGHDHAVVLEDASMAGRPEEWAREVVDQARKWQCPHVAVESNQGGDMVRAAIHAVDPNVIVKKITARGTKETRALPIATMYEQGRVHHVGFMPKLEEQMTTWVPTDSRSPDRLDALVHAIHDLLPDRPSGGARTRTATDRSV